MNKHELKEVSKGLSYALRHRPDAMGLRLRHGGWVAVDELIKAFRTAGRTMSRELLDVVVADNDKQRFEYSEDGAQIRARQGHSAPVDLGYEPSTPPNVLFHGTATRHLASIFEQGLVKGRRHHVHMSTDKRAMLDVGQRHGKPVLLAIDARRMLADGYEFFVTGNHVWLTDHVPPSYIRQI